MSDHHVDGLWIEGEEQHTPLDPEGAAFYGVLDFFPQSPFNVEGFKNEQILLQEKVSVALHSMEQDIGDTEGEDELLSSTFQVKTWRKLIDELKESVQCAESPQELERCLRQCAVTFYRELSDPKRSIRQFDYLLHLSPYEPEHWGAYGLCLIEMTAQGIHSSFNMEQRSVQCFLRSARLALAHLLLRDRWHERHGSDEALRTAREYYYNASDAYPNIVSRKGMLLTIALANQTPIPDIQSIASMETVYDNEDLSKEIAEIIGLSRSIV